MKHPWSWCILFRTLMAEFKKIIAALKHAYGTPALPPAKGPFELVMWENACYLLPDARRANTVVRTAGSSAQPTGARASYGYR